MDIHMQSNQDHEALVTLFLVHVNLKITVPGKMHKARQAKKRKQQEQLFSSYGKFTNV